MYILLSSSDLKLTVYSVIKRTEFFVAFANLKYHLLRLYIGKRYITMKKPIGFFVLVLLSFFTAEWIGAQDFDPLDVEGCTLWLDGSDPDNSGNPTSGLINTWVDKSSNGNDAFQGNSEWMPTVLLDELNNRSVIHFNQSKSNYMNLVLDNVRTIIFVLKENPGDGFNPLFYKNGDNDFFVRGADGRIWGDAGKSIIQGQTYLDGFPVVGQHRVLTPGEYHILIFSTTAPIETTTLFDFNAPFSGDVAEVISYSRVVTQREIMLLNNYLGEKWGLLEFAVPVSVEDQFYMPQGAVGYDIKYPGVLANDLNCDLLKTSIELTVPPVHGNVILSDNGSFVYNGKEGYTGDDSFYYTVTSNGMRGEKTKVNVSVIEDGNNVLPVALNDEYTIKTGYGLHIPAPGVLSNDFDLDEVNFISASLLNFPDFVTTISLSPSGALDLIPNDDFTGDITFNYRVSDGVDNSVASVLVHVVENNIPPVGSDDIYDVPAGKNSFIKAPGLLNNDYDVDNEVLTAILKSSPANGILALNPDGSFEYEPVTGYTGEDSFSYYVSDGKDKSLCTVTLNVQSAGFNFLPVGNNDCYSCSSSGGGLFIDAENGVLANDFCFDNKILLSDLVTDVKHGTLSFSNNGSFSYTPEPDYDGLDNFTYKLSGTDSLVLVSILVKKGDLTLIALDDIYSVKVDTECKLFNHGGIMDNDYSVSESVNDKLSVKLETMPFHGSLILNHDGVFTYLPESGYTGVDHFTYRVVNYGIESEPATVYLNVGVSEISRPVAGNDEYVFFNTASVRVGGSGVLHNDSDGGSSTLVVDLIQYPTVGEVDFSSDGTFTYYPVPGYYGDVYFKYTVYNGVYESSNEGQVLLHIGNETLNVPLPQDDFYGVKGGDILEVQGPGFLGNDESIGFKSSNIIFVGKCSHGTLDTRSDGGFTYIPKNGFSGIDSFKYRVETEESLESEALVTIVVLKANTPPGAIPDFYTAFKGTQIVISAPGVLANDYDLDGGGLKAEVDSLPAHGQLSFSENGGFIYTPHTSFTGIDKFIYKVYDSEKAVSSAEVSIKVTSETNTPPVAEDDSFSLAKNEVFYAPVPGLLFNDSDGDSAAQLQISVTHEPEHGVLVMELGGSFIYTPESDYTGDDSFKYRLSDGTSESNEAMVTLKIEDRAPEYFRAVNDSFTCIVADISNSSGSLVVGYPGVISNDCYDRNDVKVELVEDLSAGSLNLRGDGSFIFDSEVGTEDYLFKYKLTKRDGTESNIAEVRIEVKSVGNDSFALNDSFTVQSGNLNTISASGILKNDKGSNPVLFSKPLHGSVVLNDDGSFSYLSDHGFSGNDSFKYILTGDFGTAGPAVVNLNVKFEGNHPPEPKDDFYYTKVNTLLSVESPGFLSNDIDFDGDQIVMQSSSLPSEPNGSFTISNNGALSYLPAPGYSGIISFTYIPADGSDSSLQSGKVSILVGENTPPSANDDSYSVFSDETADITVTDGLISNDVDSEGAPLFVDSFSTPKHGNLTLNSDGAFSYVPDASFIGNDSFIYTCSDGDKLSGSATVLIEVKQPEPENNPPEAVDDSYSVNTGVNLSIPTPGLLLNDSDKDGEPLTVKIAGKPIHGSVVLNSNGSFSYTSNTGFVGDDSFTYSANDGIEDGDPATVVITVNPTGTNNKPFAFPDEYSVPSEQTLKISAPGILNNDIDPDGDSLVVIPVKDVSHGTLIIEPDGSFSYLSEKNFVGTDSFTYCVYDGKVDSSSVTVAISVTNPTNTPPSAVDDKFVINAGIKLEISAPGILSNDTDDDGEPLMPALLNGVNHGTLTLNSDGSFSYISEDGFTGEDSFLYTANDGIDDSNVATVTISVNPAGTNYKPVALPDEYSILAGSSLLVSSPGVLSNDSDANNDKLQAKLLSDVSHGVLDLNLDGSFVYKPADGFWGKDYFEYTVSDGITDGNSVIVNLAISDSRIKVTAGSQVVIKLRDIKDLPSGVNFGDKVPKLYGELNYKKLYFKKDNSSTSKEAKGIWRKKVILFDKYAVKNYGYASVINRNKQEKIIPLKVKWKYNGKMFEKSAGVVRVVPPLISSYTINNGVIVIDGFYFGAKAPKVYLESVDKKNVLINCKVDKRSYSFNPFSGKGYLIATFNTLKVPLGKYNLILYNKIGVGVDKKGKIPKFDL